MPLALKPLLGVLATPIERGPSGLWALHLIRRFAPLSAALAVTLTVLALLQPYMILEPADFWRIKGGGDLMTSVGIARGEITRTWTLYRFGATPAFSFI